MLHLVMSPLLQATGFIIVAFLLYRLYRNIGQGTREDVMVGIGAMLLLFIAMAFLLIGAGYLFRAHAFARDLTGLWAFGEHYLREDKCEVVELVRGTPDRLYCQNDNRYFVVYLQYPNELESVVTRKMIGQTTTLLVRYFPATDTAVSVNPYHAQEQNSTREINFPYRPVALYFVVCYLPPLLPYMIFAWFGDALLDKILRDRISARGKTVVSWLIIIMVGVMIGYLSYPVLALDGLAALALGDGYLRQGTCQVAAIKEARVGRYLYCSGHTLWFFYPNGLQPFDGITTHSRLTVKYFPLSGFVVELSTLQQ